MQHTLLMSAALLLMATSLRADEPAPPKGFTPLLNGKELSGWHGLAKIDPAKLAAWKDDERTAQLEAWNASAKKHWTVENGALVNDGKEPFLATDREFGDFELRLECKGDAGIFLRSSAPLWFVDHASPTDNVLGKWSSVRILMVGERCSVYLGEKLITDHVRLANSWNAKNAMPRKAPIQLLNGRLRNQGGVTHFRNIFIREIPAAEANQILSGKNAKGFTAYFNGKDFTGWAGPIDQYEVKDGAIVCKPRKGGTIYTQAEFADFVARVEFRLPPGGNNGLAIRYPGSGDTAYVGMCEIQVLDDTAKGYAKLDPRQYNGSAYGMAAAQRGYLRPVGEWNFEEVTVQGSTIKVELNGTRILDADLSEVTKYMANSPHPGKTRTKGHFGFAGHSDPVAFRNIQIKVLEK